MLKLNSFILSCICLVVSGCSALVPVAEKAGVQVVEEVVEEGIEDALLWEVRKEVFKMFSALIAISGFGFYIYLRKDPCVKTV